MSSSDGDFDIYGANWAGNPPARIWINRLDLPAGFRRLDRWSHHQITQAHVRSFGLAFSDMDGDGRTDIISGPFWYRQPADPWQGDWQQIAPRRGSGCDRGNRCRRRRTRGSDRSTRRGGETLEPGVASGAAKARARGLREHAIGDVRAASHELGSQGHALAQIVKGGQPELAVSSGAGVFYFAIPDGTRRRAPGREPAFAPRPSDEGIAFADIDGDGLL